MASAVEEETAEEEELQIEEVIGRINTNISLLERCNLGLCDNENSYITIIQLIITIIMITVLHKIHLGTVMSCAMLDRI